MPTELKQVVGSFLTWFFYEKLTMSMTWQICPGSMVLILSPVLYEGSRIVDSVLSLRIYRSHLFIIYYWKCSETGAKCPMSQFLCNHFTD
jgi:hypothetical protein